MSIRGKDFRCELDPTVHQRLAIMAEYHNVDLSTHGSRLLEKMIAAEWYEFSILLERAAKHKRNLAESGGTE